MIVTGEGTLPNAFAGSTVQPASLKALVSAPAQIELGTQAEIDLLLTNGGNVTVASPSIQLSADAGAGIVSVPTVPGDLLPGSTVHLVALVSGESRGPTMFALHASGTDAFDGHAVSADAAAQVQIVAPPSLSGSTAPPRSELRSPPQAHSAQPLPP